VTEDDPVNIGVFELLWRDFSGKGTFELGVGVLGGNLDRLLDGFLDLQQVDGRRGNDDLCDLSLCFEMSGLTSLAVEVGRVKVLHNLLDGSQASIHLEVTSVL
jgi:hypothetical protein